MSLADAAALLNTAPNTIRSRFKAGKIRGERDNAGKIWVWINPDLPHSKNQSSKGSKKVSNDAALEALTTALDRAQNELEDLRSKAARVDILDAEKTLLIEQINDLKSDRDEWRKLASRPRRGLLGIFNSKASSER